MAFERISNPIAVDLLNVDDRMKGQLEVLCGDHDFTHTLFRAFFQTPGKKLRPSLMILSAFALRQDNLRAPHHAAAYDKLITLAAIVELVHCASLMHDDVLDAALERRGSPSLNAQFGEKAAILAGDILYSQAFELLASIADKATIRLLAQCVHRMCRGEISNLRDHDFEAYLQIIEDKTAVFMELCCRVGAEAVCSGPEESETVQALASFGHHFGMVYQLIDDLGDQDDEITVSHRDQVLASLLQYIREAEVQMALVPESTYKDSLLQLLRYVVSKSECLGDAERLKNNAAERTQAVGVGR